MSVSLARGGGHDVLGLRYRAREARAVDLDDQLLALDVEGETATVADLAEPLACRPVEMSSIANPLSAESRSAARVMTEPYPASGRGLAYTCCSDCRSTSHAPRATRCRSYQTCQVNGLLWCARDTRGCVTAARRICPIRRRRRSCLPGRGVSRRPHAAGRGGAPWPGTRGRRVRRRDRLAGGAGPGRPAIRSSPSSRPRASAAPCRFRLRRRR